MEAEAEAVVNFAAAVEVTVETLEMDEEEGEEAMMAEGIEDGEAFEVTAAAVASEVIVAEVGFEVIVAEAVSAVVGAASKVRKSLGEHHVAVVLISTADFALQKWCHPTAERRSNEA